MDRYRSFADIGVQTGFGNNDASLFALVPSLGVSLSTLSGAEMLRWLIIGGGIHGVLIAARLIGDASVPPGQLHILDTGACLLERWKACTAATGMRHLRSPAVPMSFYDLELKFISSNRNVRYDSFRTLDSKMTNARIRPRADTR